MIKRVSLASVIAMILILSGCKQDKDSTTLSPYLYDYAPVYTGHYVLYDVDSVIYSYSDPVQTADTFHYQIQEFIQDTFYDNLGKVSYRIEVSKRYDTLMPLDVIDRAWYSYVSRNTYEKNEDDLRFIKLIFPPINGQTWKGNSYLPAVDTSSDTYKVYAGWVYTYSDVNLPKTVNGLAFDSTLVVTELNVENKIDKKLSREIYARHVGLIYKEWEIINKQDVNSSWDTPNKANGFRIRQRVHAYNR